MRILGAIGEQDGSVPMAELVDRLDLAKSTVYKHLITLEEHGLVVNHETGYRLGLRCLELGGGARQYDGVFDVAKPELDKLAEETGELANLMFEEQGKGVYVYTARGDQAINFDSRLGRRVSFGAMTNCSPITALQWYSPSRPWSDSGYIREPYR